jgi:predicted transcriptional regulator
MARTQTMVQLNDDLVESLDAAAERRGVSRSALIRDLLWEGLREDEHRRIGEEIAEGYRRIPQFVPDDWGDPEELSDRTAEDTLRRLDAEERAAGVKQW